MPSLKSLAKDTIIYGVSSVLGRFLNWCLVPIYTYLFTKEEYGQVTFVYSVVAIALIILTYGMETGFFRFANHERWKDPMEVYSTSLISLAATSLAFVALVAVFIEPLTNAMECSGHPSWVLIMAVCTALDAFLALPFSYLRYKSRPIRFGVVKFVNIGVNIGLNLFFIVACPYLMEKAPATVSWFYDPSFGIGYIFLANLIATVVNFVMLIPEMRGFPWRFNRRLWLELIGYSWPLLVLGVAGIMNQTIDKILYPTLASGVTKEVALEQLGIYGANYKIAVVMVMFIQAFRYAYEPFIFSQAKDGGELQKSKRTYADAMKYFVLFALIIFMGVMFYLDVIRYLISPKFFEGLKVVPVVMLAELFFGIFFNLSLWYKLTDKTIWGAVFTFMGLVITVSLNVVLVPRMGYMGCAVASVACYGTMMLVSYFAGQKIYPINYQVGRISLYVGLAAALYFIGMYCLTPWDVANYIIRFFIIGGFTVFVVYKERIPIPGLKPRSASTNA